MYTCFPSGVGDIRTVVNVSVPLLLHGNLKAAVQDLVECVDPILHLSLAV